MIQNISDLLRTKLNSWRTEENIRQTEYGDYYILNRMTSKVILRSSHFNPYVVELYFETKEEGLYICSITISPLTVESKFHTTILFPCDTTLRILNKRNLAEVLSEDQDLFSNFLDMKLVFGESLTLGRGGILTDGFKNFLERYTNDIEIKMKLEADYPITFEDIEGTFDLELREKALRKLGYERYIKEGFRKSKINYIVIGDKIFQFHNPGSDFDRIPGGYRSNREDKIIFLADDITFLQVEDSSNGKIYFIKVPPGMRRVREAKAWTFGLEEEEYNPEVET